MIFTDKSRTICRHFEKIQLRSADQRDAAGSNEQPPHLALRHVTVAAVPNGPYAATGVAILAYVFITSLVRGLLQ